MIVVIDYGVGNLGSIGNMFKRIGAEAVITADLGVIRKADKLILPGVGKYDAGMEGLKSKGVIPILNEKVNMDCVPILGICLGMQLLLKRSEEGNEFGLGYIDGTVKKFPDDALLKVPHMGWNTIEVAQSNDLTKEIPEPIRFYFAHSYYVETVNEEDSFLWTDYGIKFASGVHKENIYGVQFHPEKSHKYGMQLLRNFSTL